MSNIVKKSYENIQISGEAKKRIYQEILEGEKGNGEQRQKKLFRGRVMPGWKAGLAACLALGVLIPTSAYAIGRISEYVVQMRVGDGKYQAVIDMQKKDDHALTLAVPTDNTSRENRKYIRVKADFGEEYQLAEKSQYGQDTAGGAARTVQEGQDGMYCYNHRDGFDAGKDFYYNVMYMDQDEDFVLKLYDQAQMKEMTVNGRKAFLCRGNTVKGSRYHADYDTTYNLDLFVFYEEYGYVIDFCGMQGLGTEKLVQLAEKADVTEATRKKASRYEYLSGYDKANAVQGTVETVQKDVTGRVSSIGTQVKMGGFTYEVSDVKITPVLKDLDIRGMDHQLTELEQPLWDQDGRLQKYDRETVKVGDGVKEPGLSVIGVKKVQPKMVYVTMKVKSEEDDNLFCLPSVKFFEKNGDHYFDTGMYQKYKRPERIDEALTDKMPCYFRETEGGKGFWLKEMTKGEEQTYHFAYLVDGDMAENTALCFDAGCQDESGEKYIALH